MTKHKVYKLEQVYLYFHTENVSIILDICFDVEVEWPTLNLSWRRRHFVVTEYALYSFFFFFTSAIEFKLWHNVHKMVTVRGRLPFSATGPTLLGF